MRCHETWGSVCVWPAREAGNVRRSGLDAVGHAATPTLAASPSTALPQHPPCHRRWAAPFVLRTDAALGVLHALEGCLVAARLVLEGPSASGLVALAGGHGASHATRRTACTTPSSNHTGGVLRPCSSF